MSKFIYLLFIGTRELLSAFSTYDVAFRTKLFCCFLIFLDTFWLGTILFQVFSWDLSFQISDGLFLIMLAGLTVLLYFLFTKLEQKYKDESLSASEKKTYKRIAILWVAITFLVLLPIGVYILMPG